MKRPKKRIKWGDIGLFIVLMICASIVIHDVYMITIHAWITEKPCGWTLFGFATFIIALSMAMIIGNYLYDELQSKRSMVVQERIDQKHK